MRSVLLVVATVLMLAAPSLAVPHEDKIFIYFVYDEGSATQRRFIDALYDRFKTLGFRDFLKKEGIAWVEGNYNTLGGVTSYLDISRDDLIYFAVVTADRNDRIVREISRIRVPVRPGMKPRDIKIMADNYSQKFYYETQNTRDMFRNPKLWERQRALLDPSGHAASPVSLELNGKPLTSSAYQRNSIAEVMVPCDARLFDKLGIKASQSGRPGGAVAQLRKGNLRMDFYTGSEVQDRKIYLVDLAAGERHFIRPIDTAFAYPEMKNGTVYLPLHLALGRLDPQLQYKKQGDKVLLTR
ncbi:MAG: hypothetical protein ACYCW6_12530 [Candidatus Xenobia bacterium]